MERGSSKHSPRQDDELEAELSGMLGSAGGHREEWNDPEPPADDDPPEWAGTGTVPADTDTDTAAAAADADPLDRASHDIDVANDSSGGPGSEVPPGRPAD